MGLTSGIQHLLTSVYEIIAGIFSTILSAFQSVFNLFISTLQSIFHLFQNILSSIIDFMSGAVGFILGNIVIIGLLAAAYVGYSAYRQKNQGGGITSGKKRA